MTRHLLRAFNHFYCLKLIINIPMQSLSFTTMMKFSLTYDYLTAPEFKIYNTEKSTV